MLDLVMIAYIAALVLIALLMSAYCPAWVANFDECGLSPFGMFVLFSFIASPPLCAYLLVGQLHAWVSPYSPVDRLERLTQIIAPILMFYILIRGFAIWLALLLIGFFGFLAFCLVQYIFLG
jgi:hypothetical protein